MGERVKRGRDVGRWFLSVRWVIGAGEGGGSWAASVWKREMGRERGALARRSVAGTVLWPMGTGGQRTRA
jgi:hypothetical protein